VTQVEQYFLYRNLNEATVWFDGEFVISCFRYPDDEVACCVAAGSYEACEAARNLMENTK
jgi:hypothetical protein